jgi:hypothetical protein
MFEPRQGGEFGIFIAMEDVERLRKETYSISVFAPMWGLQSWHRRRKIMELGRERANKWFREKAVDLEYAPGMSISWREGIAQGSLKSVLQWREEGLSSTGNDPWFIEKDSNDINQGQIMIWPSKGGRSSANGLPLLEANALLMVPAKQLPVFLKEVFRVAEQYHKTIPEELLKLIIPYDEDNLQLAMLALEQGNMDEVRRNSGLRIQQCMSNEALIQSPACDESVRNWVASLQQYQNMPATVTRTGI